MTWIKISERLRRSAFWFARRGRALEGAIKSDNYHICRSRVNAADRWRERACTLSVEVSQRFHLHWIVDIDLEKFFDTVNHDKLMTLIGRTIKDGEVISIIRKFLVSGIMVDDEYKESVIGTPQGVSLSPLLANIMLNELDKEMEQRGLNVVRYADDCIIMVGSEMSARRVMRNLTKFIEVNLGFKVNVTKSKVDRPSGLNTLDLDFILTVRHISINKET